MGSWAGAPEQSPGAGVGAKNSPPTVESWKDGCGSGSGDPPLSREPAEHRPELPDSAPDLVRGDRGEPELEPLAPEQLAELAERRDLHAPGGGSSHHLLRSQSAAEQPRGLQAGVDRREDEQVP